jgi:hypothetical protein
MTGLLCTMMLAPASCRVRSSTACAKVSILKAACRDIFHFVVSALAN